MEPFQKILKVSLGGLLAVYVINLVFLSFRIGPSDADLLSTYYEIAWRFWNTSHSWLPHFNPFLMGGRSLGADAQIPVYHPFVFLVPLLGAPTVVKWELALQVAIGLWGVTRWLQYIGANQTQRLWGSFLFLAGGGIVCRVLVTHLTLGCYVLFPAYLYLSYRISDLPWKSAARHRLRLWYWALFFYSAFYKPHFVLNAAPFLVLESLLRAVVRKNISVFLETGFALAIAGILSAVVYLPSSHYFSLFPRGDATPVYMEPWVLLVNLLMPLRTIPGHWLGSQFFQRHELNFFLGPLALWFCILFFRKKIPLRKEYLVSLGALTFFGALVGCGAPGKDLHLFLPYSWLREFWPGLANNRVPTRFWFFAYVGIVAFSSLGLTLPKTRIQKFLWVLLGVVPLFLSASINLFKISFDRAYSSFEIPIGYVGEWTWAENGNDHSYPNIRKGLSALGTHHNLEVIPNDLLHPGPLLETTSDKNLQVRSSFTDWNRISIDAKSDSPFDVSFNLNPHPFWRFEGQGEVLPTRGTGLTLRSSGNRLIGEAVYETPLVKEGALISLVGLLLTLVAGFSLWLWTRNQFKVIGLTGGMGSGKSTLANILRERGYLVYDLDHVGHEILEHDPSIPEKLAQAFGKEVLSSGKPDRAKLKETVFSDPSKKKKLEALLHPLILQAFEKKASAAKLAGKKKIFCEAALLIEGGYFRKLDELWVVFSPENDRIERVKNRDGIGAHLIHRILDAQTTDEQRMAYATRRIQNVLSEEFLKQQVDKLL